MKIAPMTNKKNSGYRLKRLIEDRGSEYASAILLNNLSPEEALIISDYADLFASEINGKLRNKTTLEQDLKKEQELNYALDKVEPYENSVVYVDFGVYSDEEEIYAWFEKKIGKVVQFPNFLGSSKNKWPDRNFYLRIETRSNSSGKFIAPLTGKKHEDEVLFKSKSNFEVLRVDRLNSTIELKEVHRNKKPNNILFELYYLNQK